MIADLADIFFINDDEGWVTTRHTFSEEGGSILHTSDGGMTWQVQTTTRSCRFIHMIDENVGYAASDDGMIYKTIDGGNNWILHGITATQVTGMSFPPGSDTGYVCSYATSRMHRITPEGLETINFDNAPFWWQSISAASHDLIWISNLTSVYTYDQDGLTDQPVSSDNYNSIYFKRNDLGWGCGSHGVKGRNQGTIMGCVGKNIPWVVLSYTDGPLYDVFALDEDHIWAGGVYGQIYYAESASDFGFDTQTSTGWSDVEFINQPVPRPDALIRSVFFTSEQNGFASANENILFKYGPVSGIEDQGGMEAGGQGGVEVWPNPTSGVVSLQSSGLLQGSVFIKLFDCNGVDVFEEETRGRGDKEMSFDISHLPAGVYFCRIESENQTVVKKIILLK